MATLLYGSCRVLTLHLNLVENSADSILAMIGRCLVAPIFAAWIWRLENLYSTDHRIYGKESVVSHLSILFGNTAALLDSITPLSAASLLAFCLLYTPCVAAIASIKRELGSKWAAGVVIGQCVIAWLAALVVYLVGGLIF